MKTIIFSILLLAASSGAKDLFFSTPHTIESFKTDCASCTFKNKTGCRQNACTYNFECTTSDGTVKKVSVAASNDNEAKGLAMLECD